MQTSPGFTLIELIVAVAIAGILLTVAVPSYQYVITTNRMVSEMNDFVTSVYLARSQAVKRGQYVTMCIRLSRTTCDTANTARWDRGWIIFSDSNKDKVLGANDQLLAVYPALTRGDTLKSNSNVKSPLIFSGNGFMTGAANGTVTLNNAGADQSYKRCVVFSYGQHVHTEKGDHCN